MSIAEAPTARRGHFKRWHLREQCSATAEIARQMKLSPLVVSLLATRKLADLDAAEKFLKPRLADLYDPALLPGCARAAERLVQAVRQDEPIVIYGDYDVDGITATAILYHIIKAARPDARVSTYIPHRIEEGYGLNTDAITELCGQGAAVIVSVDCGITALEPAAVARDRGVDLIITDHHQMSQALPDAYALVHPGLKSDTPYPFAEICGAGVAYKLAWQFARSWCGSDRVSRTFREALVNLLPLAALGTVADVVPLMDENRVIVSHGLRRIKHTPWPGLNALIDTAQLRAETIDAYHVGFVLGPRLNACGRMGHAADAVELLTTAGADRATEIATFLNTQNNQRRQTERDILERAVQMIEEAGYDQDDCRTIVLADASWHSGVVGIVCSRLVDRYGKPAVLLCISPDGAQGSARSIDGFNLYEALASCESHLETFGGHAMAAGLKLSCDKVDAFRDAMSRHALAHLTADQMVPSIHIDGIVTLDQLSHPAVRELDQLQPFGRGNPAPVLLMENVTLKQAATTMGRGAAHLSLIACQHNHYMRCIGWRMGELHPRLPAGAVVDLVAQPRINTFNGRSTVELTIQDLRWH